MINYDLSKDTYNRVLRDQFTNKRQVLEIKKGSSLSMYWLDSGTKELFGKLKHDKSFDCGNLTMKNFSLFLAEFKKNLHKQVICNDLLDLKINFRGTSRDRNLKFWDTIPINTRFFGIDIKAAYWQMGYKLGYISERLYKSYFDLTNYKQAKRLCFSFLARDYKSINYSNNEIIHCDTSSYQRIYNNIRNLLYTHIKNISELTEGKYISYNTDGIYVLESEKAIIMDYLKQNGIEFKVTWCRKLTDNTYMNGSKLSYMSKPRELAN